MAKLIYKLIIIFAVIYLFFVYELNEYTPIGMFNLILTGHPIAEAEIKGSVQYLCTGKFPFSMAETGSTNVNGGVFSKNSGGITESEISIDISNGTDADERRGIIAHENCHKRQLLRGDYNNLTCEKNYTRLIELERECKYIGLKEEMKK